MYLLYEIAGHTFGFVTRAPGCPVARRRRSPPCSHRVGKALLVSSALCLMPLTDASAHIPEESGPDPGCTVLEGTRQISLEVIAPHSADFCPLLARAVGEDVLHARVGITPALWHQAGATRTCRLHLGTRKQPQITIYNSRKACRWLQTSGWLPVEPPPAWHGKA